MQISSPSILVAWSPCHYVVGYIRAINTTYCTLCEVRSVVEVAQQSVIGKLLTFAAVDRYITLAMLSVWISKHVTAKYLSVNRTRIGQHLLFGVNFSQCWNFTPKICIFSEPLPHERLLVTPSMLVLGQYSSMHVLPNYRWFKYFIVHNTNVALNIIKIFKSYILIN